MASPLSTTFQLQAGCRCFFPLDCWLCSTHSSPLRTVQAAKHCTWKDWMADDAIPNRLPVPPLVCILSFFLDDHRHSNLSLEFCVLSCDEKMTPTSSHRRCRNADDIGGNGRATAAMCENPPAYRSSQLRSGHEYGHSWIASDIGCRLRGSAVYLRGEQARAAIVWRAVGPRRSFLPSRGLSPWPDGMAWPPCHDQATGSSGGKWKVK